MAASAQSNVEVMFEAADAAADPEKLISKYLKFELHRLTRDHFKAEMTGSLQERMHLLLWYLTAYVQHRNAEHKIPLSADQIAFLNKPMPIAGASPAVTVAFWHFVARELPTHLQLDNAITLREAVYWWCIQKMPSLRLEGALVTPDQIAILKETIPGPGGEFPLNGFMAGYFAHHPELQSLNMEHSRDRGALFFYLMLLSYKTPYLSQFLPADAVRKMMALDPGGTSKFDRIVARQVYADRSKIEQARALRDKGERLLKKSGYWYGRFEKRRPHGHFGRCYDNRLQLGPEVEPGVALIGPIHQTSGLGQATRLSYDILSRAESHRPTVHPFAMDNPAPVGFASTFELNAYDRKREINLIHLNAESIPLAFAYEDKEVFSDSYNIGYFFWELNKIPKCQHLALEMLDEIWVSSEYNREIYESYTGKPVINVGMAVEPLPSVGTFDRATYGLDPGSCIFLTTFDSFSFIERKNPLAVLEAFRAAFPNGDEKVHLVIKTQNRTKVGDPHQIGVWRKVDRFVQADPRMLIIDETLTYADLLALKAGCDCYVSLHRSEGWGFGMIEAMQLAKPVIATAYSGNMDFCHQSTAYLVDYQLIGVQPSEYIFVERGSVWADPSVEHAATLMKQVASDPQGARRKGEQAARFIADNFSLDRIAKRYGARLAAVRDLLKKR